MRNMIKPLAVVVALGAFCAFQGANADTPGNTVTFTYTGHKLRPFFKGEAEPGIAHLVVSATGTLPAPGASNSAQITQIYDGVRQLTYFLNQGWDLNPFFAYTVCSDVSTAKLSV